MTASSKRDWMGSAGSLKNTSIPIAGQQLAQKRIFVTGAGGSIGSALVQAIAKHGPSEVLLVDAAEQALYQIDRSLNAPHKAILANVCDAIAVEEALERYRPHIVFHAAAHKHVALMEAHPFAAVENNTIGAFKLAQLALRYGVEQFILVSTDKAVDPAGIMGASKRLAELTVLALQTSRTKIKAVRLGNVYGSQGSVVPLFQEQIARGGPLTVTDAEATRYFLSLEQAAALLLFALSEEAPGAILVPEFNAPDRIEEIARRLILQSGSKPEIIHTGLCSGEKLHERLYSDEEILLGEPGAALRPIHGPQISREEAEGTINALENAIRERSLSRMLDEIRRLIPAYRPSETVLSSQSAECRV
ncbi:MAG: polysaccharide biosynthesis protein [Acidobacteriaceae bacterium]